MKEDSKNKRIILAGIFLVIIVVILIVVVAVLNGNKPDYPGIDDGPGEEMEEKSLVFYNRDILTSAFNLEFSAAVLDNIESTVFSESEMKYSEDNSSKEGDNEIYYDAVIDSNKFSVTNVFTIEFEVDISDQRQYTVITRTDSLYEDFNYIYTGVLRNGGDKIFVYINGNDINKDSFIEFVKQKMGSKPIEMILVELQNETE